MPELPEVESLRRSLEPRLLGRTVAAVTLHRRDVVATPEDPPGGFTRADPHARLPRKRVPKQDLLLGHRITATDRRGKALALLTDQNNGPALIVRLGMTGSLLHAPPGSRLHARGHVHVTWRLDDASRLVFRDPRRFGGLWTLPLGRSQLGERWSLLGPDALTITPSGLADACAGSVSPIKARLLDQSAIAGVGNIYADEALFHARIHPACRACDLGADQVERLATELVRVLAQAISAGGSTIRDYTGSDGETGRFQASHAVYGRAGLPCPRCGQSLTTLRLAQRTTVCCPHCQPESTLASVNTT